MKERDSEKSLIYDDSLKPILNFIIGYWPDEGENNCKIVEAMSIKELGDVADP